MLLAYLKDLSFLPVAKCQPWDIAKSRLQSLCKNPNNLMTRLHYTNKDTGTCWPPKFHSPVKSVHLFLTFSLFILASFTRSSFYLDTMRRLPIVRKPRSRCLSRHWLTDSWAPWLREPFGYSDMGQEHRLPLLVSQLTSLSGLMETSLEPKSWWLRVCGAAHPGLLKIPQRRVPTISYSAWSRCIPPHGCVDIFVTSLKL